jgi:hypothetical protein
LTPLWFRGGSTPPGFAAKTARHRNCVVESLLDLYSQKRRQAAAKKSAVEQAHSTEAPLDSPQQQKNENYHQNQTEASAWSIAPVSAVRPARQSTYQQDNQNNHQD